MSAEPYDVFRAAQDAIEARGEGGWEAAAKFAAKRLQMGERAALLGMADFATFARVKVAEHPGAFVVAAEGEPALLAPWPDPPDPSSAQDLVAFALDRPQAWRLTRYAAGWWCGEQNAPAPPVLKLRQDPRRWLRDYIAFSAQQIEPDGHPSRAPAGILVLAPGAVDWTRKGWLKGIEQVEILDGPVTCALAKAIRDKNPTLGTARGVALVGARA